MTDYNLTNSEMPTPKKLLKAFVQHTCAGEDELPEKMGERIANERFGWDRGTSPVDFIDDPFGESARQ